MSRGQVEQIELLRVESGAERAAWDAFVSSQSGSLYTETDAWREALGRAFSLDDLHLLARAGGRVLGAAGLFFNRGLVTGRHAISAPLSCSGGGLYYESAEVLAALLAEVEKVTRERRLRYTLFQLVDRFDRSGWQVNEDYLTFSLGLSPEPGQVWEQALSSNARRQIRRAQRHDFEFRHGPEQFEAFLDVVHRGVQELGSPFPGRKLFGACLESFPPGAVDFGVLYRGGRPAAGSVLFFHQHTVSVPWIRTLREHNPFAANSLLYWEVIRLGCERGMRALDLGRSRAGSTNAAFKRHLGARERPFYYHYLFPQGGKVPDLDPNQSGFRVVRSLWSRLPRAVSRALGRRAMKELI